MRERVRIQRAARPARRLRVGWRSRAHRPRSPRSCSQECPRRTLLASTDAHRVLRPRHPLTFLVTGMSIVRREGAERGPLPIGVAMNVELLYFDGCPHWRVADERLRAAAHRRGLEVRHRLVTTAAEAEAAHFRGSPTILI